MDDNFQPVDNLVARRLLVAYIYQNRLNCAPVEKDDEDGVVDKVRDLFLEIEPYKYTSQQPKKLNSEKNFIETLDQRRGCHCFLV